MFCSSQIQLTALLLFMKSIVMYRKWVGLPFFTQPKIVSLFLVLVLVVSHIKEVLNNWIRLFWFKFRCHIWQNNELICLSNNLALFLTNGAPSRLNMRTKSVKEWQARVFLVGRRWIEGLSIFCASVCERERVARSQPATQRWRSTHSLVRTCASTCPRSIRQPPRYQDRRIISLMLPSFVLTPSVHIFCSFSCDRCIKLENWKQLLSQKVTKLFQRVVGLFFYWKLPQLTRHRNPFVYQA